MDCNKSGKEPVEKIVENNVGKGENAVYQHFLFFTHCFPLSQEKIQAFEIAYRFQFESDLNCVVWLRFKLTYEGG